MDHKLAIEMIERVAHWKEDWETALSTVLHLAKTCVEVEVKRNELHDCVWKYLDAVEDETGQATALRELSKMVGWYRITTTAREEMDELDKHAFPDGY